MTTGSKVVCIDDQFDPRIAAIYDALPAKDQIYIIREVMLGCDANKPHLDEYDRAEVTVYLHGLVNPTNSNGIERGFKAERFRELDSLENHEEQEEHINNPKETVPCL